MIRRLRRFRAPLSGFAAALFLMTAAGSLAAGETGGHPEHGPHAAQHDVGGHDEPHSHAPDAVQGTVQGEASGDRDASQCADPLCAVTGGACSSTTPMIGRDGPPLRVNATMQAAFPESDAPTPPPHHAIFHPPRAGS